MRKIFLFAAGILLSTALGTILFSSRAGCGDPPIDGTGGPAAEKVFEAPPLGSLEDVKWMPRRMAYGVDSLREALAREPAPIPDAEALALLNADRDENRKIRGALGRLPASDDEVDWDASLVVWIFVPPSTLNPIFFRSAYETYIGMALYATPFGFEPAKVTIDGQERIHFVPFGNRDVAVEWSSSQDGTMDRVVLRDDLTWSDGIPFTAQDIEFSFRVIAVEKAGALTNYNLILKELKGVKAYDDRTVVYFHRERQATNFWNINFPIIPRHRYEPLLAADPTLSKGDEAARLGRSPVTNGPYRVVSWDPTEGVTCERRTEWHERDGKTIRPKPLLKTIRYWPARDRTTAYNAFLKGSVDIVELSADLWHDQYGGGGAGAAAAPGAFFARGTRVRGDEWHYAFIAWNQKPPAGQTPFFADRKVREAMTCAFPHAEFIGKISRGLVDPAPGIFHPDAWMADPTLRPPRQDLPRAARLLAEAGWTDSDDDGVLDKEIGGVRVPFRFPVGIAAGSPVADSVASILRRDLRKLLVVCDPQALDGQVFMAKARAHDFQAIGFVWQTGVDPDMSRNVWTTEAIQSGGNFVGYSNSRVDELYEKGRREFDPAKRAAIYREIERTIVADFPYTLLYIKTSFYAVSRDLRGFNLSPRGPFSYTPGILSLWKTREKFESAGR